MGVARVNGDLAVSRAFGDAQHKNTGGLFANSPPDSWSMNITELDHAAS